jgi:G protein-coupled receptor GPR1
VSPGAKQLPSSFLVDQMERSIAMLLFLFLPLVSSSPLKQSLDSAFTSAEARNVHRTYQVRLAALSCSGISLTASLLVFYWFCRMDKLFRHRWVTSDRVSHWTLLIASRLIMLLLDGDLTRATAYFVFAVASQAQEAVRTKTAFCQLSGLFIKYGTETSGKSTINSSTLDLTHTDYAVLVIAMHSALQVLRPATQGTSDGLYQYRYYIYSGGVLVPNLMAGLAFVNPGPAYLFQGAICTLPIRPFWYRLALAWIPLYLIISIIVGLAIAIYTYVGFDFRSYARLSQSINTPMTTTPSKMSHGDKDACPVLDTPSMAEQAVISSRRASSVAHDIVASQR